jgi:hypothetical protein
MSNRANPHSSLSLSTAAVLLSILTSLGACAASQPTWGYARAPIAQPAGPTTWGFTTLAAEELAPALAGFSKQPAQPTGPTYRGFVRLPAERPAASPVAVRP